MNNIIKCCPKCNLPYENQDFGPYVGPSCECWLEEAIKNNPMEIDDYDYIDDPGDHPHDTGLSFEEEMIDPDFIEQNYDCFQLKQKYGVPSFNDANLEPVLMNILASFDQGNEINNSFIKWLTQHNLYIVAAQIYYAKFQKNNDQWDLAKAGKWYRKSSNPEKVIEITNISHPSAAVLTTRGAAYRVLNSTIEAFNCANAAIDISPQSPHPYNLKGGIYFDLKEYEKGHQCFLKARELSQPNSPDYQHVEIKRILQSNSPDKKEVAQFFFNKDPQNFSWVQSYLK